MAPKCKPVAFTGTLEQKRWRMCQRKRRFVSLAEAEAGARGQAAYKCPACKHWHRTSRRKKAKV